MTLSVVLGVQITRRSLRWLYMAESTDLASKSVASVMAEKTVNAAEGSRCTSEQTQLLAKSRRRSMLLLALLRLWLWEVRASACCLLVRRAVENVTQDC